MFDFRLLSASHFLLLLISFTGSYFAIARLQPRFAGAICAIVASVLSILVLDSWALALGLFAAVGVVIIVGRADEEQPLSATAQLFWQLVIGLVLVLSGWSIPYVSNPVGEGVIHLGIASLPLTLAWIILMMNAMNWLDGLDGLAGAVGTVAFITLAAVSLLPATQDATTLSLALIGAGSLLGFFLHNAPPAKVYLGTTGSWFAGLFLALTALIGGGKVATATLVLALPILDAGFVVIQRLLSGQRPWVGDKKHLHYRLVALGWPTWGVVAAAAATSLLLGLVAVAAQTYQKIWALLVVALFLAATILSLLYRTYVHQNTSRRRPRRSSHSRSRLLRYFESLRKTF